MIYEIYTENGTKKKRALTGNGYGVPLGSIIAVYSNLVPDGYLPCNGAAFDTTTYAALYAYLGSNRLPDLRECALVGAGQSSNDYDASTNPNGIHEHDVYSVGEFKDDQLQGHWHDSIGTTGNTGSPYNIPVLGCDYHTGTSQWARTPTSDGTNGTPRIGSTTHGKQVGVNYCIKATPAYVEPDTVSDMVNTLRTQDSYSTSEVNTGKKWIDGRPIYRFGFTYIGNISAAWTPVYSDATFMSNVDLVLSALLVDNTIVKGTYPAPSRTDNGVLQVFTQGGWYADKIFIEYVKTTD